MMYHSLAITRLNQLLHTMDFNHPEYKDVWDSVDSIEDVEIHGGLLVVVYARYGERRIINCALSQDVLAIVNAEVMDKTILVALVVNIGQGHPATLLEHGHYPVAEMTDADIESVNAMFSLKNSFHAINGWFAGDSYVVHGIEDGKPVIYTPFVDPALDWRESIGLAVEAGNGMRLSTEPQKHQVYMHLGDNHFYIPTNDEYKGATAP